MEVGEDEHVIVIELDQQWDDDEMVPPSDNEIESPPLSLIPLLVAQSFWKKKKK